MQSTLKNIGTKSAGLIVTSVCAALIAFLSIGYQNSFGISFGSDKIMHAIAYTALVLPIALTQPRSLLWFLPIAMVFGGIIELIQPHFGRSREGLDLVANATGLGLGSIIGASFHRLFWVGTGRKKPEKAVR